MRKGAINSGNLPRAISVSRLLTTVLIAFAILMVSCTGGGDSGANDPSATSPVSTSGGSPSTVAVLPATATLGPGQTATFTATVDGLLDQGVSWSVNGIVGGTVSTGTITSFGVYTAPSAIPTATAVTVTATIITTSTASGKATVTLEAPTITSVSPAQGAPGSEIQISGVGFGNLTQTVVFSGPHALSIATAVDFVSPTQVSVKVPLEAGSGPLFVQVPDPNGTPTNSNSVPFSRMPNVRIRAARKDLAAGEQTTFQAAIFPVTSMQNVVWSADQGTITTAGTYSAPAFLASDTFSYVTGCIQGTQICDTLLLGLHPFRTDPSSPVVGLGGMVQMQAIQGNGVIAPTWMQVNGEGTLLPGGAYTASNSAADGGGTVISANYQNSQEQASIAVTGGFPGLVNRIFDYSDQNNLKNVTTGISVAVSGSYAYVLSGQSYGVSYQVPFYYIDVFDITDPTHPVWIDSVEAAAAGNLYAFGRVLYDVAPFYSGSYPGGAVGAYDITSGIPVLIARQFLPNFYGAAWSFTQGVITGFEQGGFNGNAASIVDQFFLSGNTFVERRVFLPPPVQGAEEYVIFSVAATLDRLYVTEQPFYISSQPVSPTGILAAYDPSSNPALLLGTAPDSLRGTQAFLNGSQLYADNNIFDVSSASPTQLGSFPEGGAGSPPLQIIDASGTLLLARTQQSGLRLIDLTNPANPRTIGVLNDAAASPEAGVLSGTRVYSAEGLGGLGIYDVSAPGGQAFLSQLDSGFVAVSQTSDGTALFAAGGDAFTGGVQVYDLHQQPPTLLNFISTGSSTSNAVALSGGNLFVGTDQSLLTLNVSNPSQPTLISSQHIGIDSLLVYGSFLFAGTFDNRLVVFNIGNPNAPAALASVNLPDLPIQLTITGSLLLVADRVGGLLVFNVSSPAMPALIAQLTVPPAVLGVQADGNLAVLAALETGLVIVDLTNPANPSIISETALDSNNPFGILPLLFRNRAAIVTLQDKIVFIGVNNFDPSDAPNNGNGIVAGDRNEFVRLRDRSWADPARHQSTSQQH